MTPDQVTNELRRAHELLRQGTLDSAITQLKAVIRVAPDDDRAFYLLGVAQAQAGNLAASISAFRRGVEITPDHAGGWSNLGTALLQDGQAAEAIEAFERAQSLAPGNVDLLYPLAMAHAQLGQKVHAKRLVGRLLSSDQNHAMGWLLLAQLEQADGQYDDALAHYDRCLALNPDSAPALHGKSVVLKQRKQHASAVRLAQQAVNLQPGLPGAHRNLAQCYLALGDPGRAIDVYQAALARKPLDTRLHDRLNHLLWVEGRPEFLDSYKHVLAQKPDAHPLRREFAFKLIQAGRLDAAEAQTSLLVEQDPDIASSHLLHGGILRRKRQFEAAIDAHREAVRLDPHSKECQQELATSLLANWDGQPALDILRQLRAADPLHQGHIALEATALRILGREEYHELYDYDRLLLSAVLEPPGGFPTIQAFNRELRDYLLTLHTSREHPLDQSLVNGTQTVDELFDNEHELIQLLRICLQDATGKLLKTLPGDDQHPTLSRLTDTFTCTGAWSVRLRSSGFHVNHFHSHGWFSGPYYVDLPRVVEDDIDQQGWIKFGEPGFECVQPLPPDRVMRPEPGLMIRFPSYLWHGTIPFESAQERLVVSVDLEPA